MRRADRKSRTSLSSVLEIGVFSMQRATKQGSALDVTLVLTLYRRMTELRQFELKILSRKGVFGPPMRVQAEMDYSEV